MNNVSLDIARKELSAFFASPIGYLFLAVYLGVTLFVFFWVEQFFARNIADVRPMFEWLPILLIFLAAALTMRTWSDERRVGTIEFLSTLPTQDWEVALGKFVACFLLLAIALILTLPLPITVASLGSLDWGPVFAGYVASLLLGASYLSIGVFVSSRTDNQIVALIVSVLVCTIFYALGSSFVTGLVDNNIADLLRGLGSGSRFESITRGVVDFRDLYFYISVTATFLILNVYALRSMSWSDSGNEKQHRDTLIDMALLIVIILMANVWLNYVKVLRWDVTEGDQYSISDVTQQQLSQLTEPMVIRGYFSSKTHPLLAPLVPQLRDLLAEYEVSSRNRVRVEIVDPTANPEAEDEANSKYGIRPVPFQVSDRHEASVVSSYFNVLIVYGDEFEVLGFQDLIEVKAANEFDLEVVLNNPEYRITKSIKKVQSGFRSGGSSFDFIQYPVQFIGYLSNSSTLPPELEEGREPLESVLQELQEESDGKFTWSILEPEADGGVVAEQIAAELGLQPMAASLFDVNRFYFYLTIRDSQIVVTIPLPSNLDADGFRRSLEEGLKRFATGLLTSVALYHPPQPMPQAPNNPYAPPPPQVDQFNELMSHLSTEYDVQQVQLDDPLPTETDVLFVVQPDALDATQVFNVDQFLMAGGTVVVASSAYTTSLTQQMMTAIPTNTGMSDWLASHGVEIEKAMLMDSSNTKLALPVTRQVGPISIQEIKMFDYPFFLELLEPQFGEDQAMFSGLRQLALPWSSPIAIAAEKQGERQVTELLRSSTTTWRDASPDIMPKIEESGLSPYLPTDTQQSELVSVLLSGRFSSFFTESPVVEEAREAAAEEAAAESESDAEEAIEEEELTEPEDMLGEVAGVIAQSPESARLIVIGSSAFVADQALGLLSSSRGQRYTNSMQLLANITDWAVEDTGFMSIRGRGQFTRTLPSLSSTEKQIWEYLNYGIAVVLIVGVIFLNAVLKAQRTRRYRAMLGVTS